MKENLPQGKPCCFPGCFLPWWLARGRRRKQGKEPRDGGREPNAFSLLPHLSSCFSGRWRTGPSVSVPARGSRGLPGSHGPGMCSLLHFYHNNSLINSPAAAAVAAQTCASEGVGHVALPEPREGARSARPLPLPALALPRHRKFLVLRCCCNTCFWEVTFNKYGVDGLFKWRQNG